MSAGPAMTAFMPESPPTIKLGPYEVESRIAVGGMASVYRARRKAKGGFDRRFALKVIHPHLTREDGFIERFYDEARIASRIRHPNVVSTIGIETQGHRTFLVLELIDGVTLRQLERHRDAPLPAGVAARVLADAARGLHAVHTVADEDGVGLEAIHRDISPHNLMIDTEGRALLIDLGLVKARGQLGHTQTGVLAGKLPYMSPEQSMLQPLDARSDVFSLGSVLFEMVTGAMPFGDDHAPDTLERLRVCDRGELAGRLADAGVEPWLSSVILACLHADPAQRFASALSLAEALEDELRNVGANDSELRRWLSTHARATDDALAPEGPVDAAELGVEVRLRDRTSPIWAGLAVAAAAAAAFYGATAWQRTQSDLREEPASLSVDRAVDELPEQSEPRLEAQAKKRKKARRDAALDVPPEAAPENEAEAEPEGGAEAGAGGEAEAGTEPAPRPRRRRRPKAAPTPPPEELKDNPYKSTSTTDEKAPAGASAGLKDDASP